MGLIVEEVNSSLKSSVVGLKTSIFVCWEFDTILVCCVVDIESKGFFVFVDSFSGVLVISIE